MEANAKVTNNSTLLGEFQSLSSGKDSYCVILATMVYSPSLLHLHNVVVGRVEHFQSCCCICKGGFLLYLFYNGGEKRQNFDYLCSRWFNNLTHVNKSLY